MIEGLLSLFVVHCVFPIFIFFLAFTLGLRDFKVRWGAREFMKNVLRKFI